VPYHQNVYDLLGIEPTECPDAARMIAEHEAQHGPFPASVREWHTLPEVLQKRYYPPETPDLAGMLQLLTTPISTDQPDIFDLGSYNYLEFDGKLNEEHVEIKLDHEDDPLTMPHNEYGSWALPINFSDHIWFVVEAEHVRSGLAQARPLWLRAKDEPFQPPVIDFLTDHFGEPERTPRPGDVTTYTFRPTGGTVRVTADEPALTGGLSAWWVHADIAERLAEFARLLLPWGTLRDTLRADTAPAREVLGQLKGERPV
jgi:hypothetical protein